MSDRRTSDDREPRPRYVSLLPYVVVIVLSTIGFAHMQTVTDRIEQEAIDRAISNCLLNNELRTTILEVVRSIPAPEEERASDPQVFQERERFFREAEQLLELVPCDAYSEDSVLHDGARDGDTPADR